MTTKKVVPLHPVPEPAAKLTRREFLKGTAVLSGTLAVGSVLGSLAPSHSWAAEMQVFSEQEAAFMLRLTQVIFPHENMPEAINALAVKDLDAIASDDAIAQSFRDGMVALNEATGGDWLTASAEDQATAIADHTDLDLFKTVRGTCITSLYNNELAFEHFGYEGAAFSKGGYLTRGFNDLAWLPDPPSYVSPPHRS